ncbi:3-beta hydroxysteroid dehydrogenase [Bartonella henselae]|uniref:NADH-ubiquinone oxidoreductase n=1 Tax=Bartonella henselae TaxID=38323 RepID=X5LRU4_BARHN|nr:complex I NDUFA9 subunit family protein [Bartonella henselae]MDM9996673.1 complex I NDUFA9 subunit family protein [Bartonella henselae]OLL37930.1 3-beta hydroxysteroid dehydrogenase [Bartonella henselae]OLL49762.1 3-beta hydroxysteroid dehydrogenase [Bartonella henselae]OLL50288.1 3-beta hydroxysteroid dehydrogenase [Bartonella henselae]OLL51549.1 3-beta hydroxysteroid dehydrogenase [Bartonella henselae]
MQLDCALYQHPKLITVFGGSGFVGRHVVEALTKRGYRVRIAVRSPQKAYYMLQIGEVGQTQMLRTDIKCRASVARALLGSDGAVFLPGSLAQANQPNFQKTQIEGAQNVSELTAEAGIPLIYMSALVANKNASFLYARVKSMSEEIIHNEHPQATIMRPSIIFGPEDCFFNNLANLSCFLPIIPLFGGGQSKLQPVYVGDVAEFIVRALEGQVISGKSYDLGGPQIITFQNVLEYILKIIHRKKTILSMPLSAGLFIGGLLGTIGKLPLAPTLVTASQIRFLQIDNIVSQEAIENGYTLEGVGITPKAMAALLPSYLWRFRPHGQFSRNLPA